MDFGHTTRRRTLGDDPMGFSAPRASRYFLGELLDLVTGGSKGRANEYQRLFGEQRDWMRGRFNETEQTGQHNMNIIGNLLKRSQGRDYSAMGAMRNLAAGQLNATGKQYKDRIGQVQGAINQVGQTARSDIMDQGRKQGAATSANLQRRGLGSSTMLAGAQAQNQAATGRGLSSLAEGMATVRGGALERTTGDLADFMKFRSQYEPGLVTAGRAFTREGDQALAGFGERRTGFETGLKDQHTVADSSFFQNLINAAVGGKGVNSGLMSNMLNSGENMALMLALSGGFGGGGGGGSAGGTDWAKYYHNPR